MGQKEDSISVKVFFWYGCPHCQLLDKEIQNWQIRLPSNVQIEKIPVAFGSPWVEHARLFYAVQQFKIRC